MKLKFLPFIVFISLNSHSLFAKDQYQPKLVIGIVIDLLREDFYPMLRLIWRRWV